LPFTKWAAEGRGKTLFRAPGALRTCRFQVINSTRTSGTVFAQKLILSCLLIIRGVWRAAKVDEKIERFQKFFQGTKTAFLALKKRQYV
jgi:hypothetical protein